MNYYIHRISHHAELSYPLLDKGYLSIGFSDFTNEELITQSQTGDGGYLDHKFKEVWGILPRNRNSLGRFLSFKKGDLILVPSWGSFSICQILDDYAEAIGNAYSADLKTWDGKEV